MPNFTMMDAMNAIKIGDSRMDSGYGNGNLGDKPVFNVHERLLPDEVCWLIDQTFAAEMAWHQGITLTQTVFTNLYVLHLGTYHFWSTLQGVEPCDRQRPEQLINLVLAAGVLGMAKSVDLAWREFAKGCVYEHEDWQADKAGMIMMEHVSTKEVLSLIKTAVDWLQTYDGIESRSRHALLERLQLRKLWLDALHLRLPADCGQLWAHVAQIRHTLGRIRMIPIESPVASSAARLAIDCNVKRRLRFTSPLEELTLPSLNETWDFFDELLAGLGDACDISDKRSPLNWENLLLLVSRQKPQPRYSAFVRASTSYAMYDGSRVLGELAPEWLADTVLQELAGLLAGTPQYLLGITTREDLVSSMQQCILKFAELLSNYYTTLCHNRPRQRRIYSNALVHWRDLLLLTADLEHRFVAAYPNFKHEGKLLKRLHLTMQYYRCGLALEVVFSGFELELYYRSEWLPIFRFVSALLRRQCNIVNGLLSEVLENTHLSASGLYLQTQSSLLSALQAIVYGSIMGLLSCDPGRFLLCGQRVQHNMERRFKWALPENGIQDDLQPDWTGNWDWVQEHAVGDENHLRKEAIKWFNNAQASLDGLLRGVDRAPFYDLCRQPLRSALGDLIRTCDKSRRFWHKTIESGVSITGQIDWAPLAHPWFLVPHERLDK
ncbi:hypothetical protein DACRYDRAFT_113890 [Dacryopinax primogenitus]|uniref:Mak10-domain-containing protein n=1 Tax=Dacryopinax primogenitus (strain DJM 731) TaxID=1858805 RepID=M5G6I5_DACPD|nr:uncharacterized protein DACRYDRAFT_113890 [Dacryopinax primogenitus]EJU05866.1 hypothetical protein DACRYDRAFT_113890 [Dacryopinax primogenitus]